MASPPLLLLGLGLLLGRLSPHCCMGEGAGAVCCSSSSAAMASPPLLLLGLGLLLGRLSPHCCMGEGAACSSSSSASAAMASPPHMRLELMLMEHGCNMSWLQGRLPLLCCLEEEGGAICCLGEGAV